MLLLPISRSAEPAALLYLLNCTQINEKDDPHFASLLCISERERYYSISRRERRRQFLLGRMLLRSAVSTATGLPANRIALIERRGSAPLLLSPDPTAWNFTFSISHSRQWVACAIGIGCRLGVDIEVNDPTREFQEISRVIFHPNDHQWIASQEGADQERAFYKLWCIREALLKVAPEAWEQTPSLAELAGWFAYSSVQDGFTTAVCSNRPLKTLTRAYLSELQ